jgi:hypothetical protein
MDITLPKSITVAGSKIKVEVTSFKGSNCDDFGEYLHDDRLIRINNKLNNRDIINTLRHEMMEAALLISGVGFSERYEQEAVVRCMEDIFFPAWGRVLLKIDIDLGDE